METGKGISETKRYFKATQNGYVVKRAPGSLGPADIEVINPRSGKYVALVQVKASRFKGKAYLPPGERAKLKERATLHRTKAYLLKIERGRAHWEQV